MSDSIRRGYLAPSSLPARTFLGTGDDDRREGAGRRTGHLGLGPRLGGIWRYDEGHCSLALAHTLLPTTGDTGHARVGPGAERGQQLRHLVDRADEHERLGVGRYDVCRRLLRESTRGDEQKQGNRHGLASMPPRPQSGPASPPRHVQSRWA